MSAYFKKRKLSQQAAQLKKTIANMKQTMLENTAKDNSLRSKPPFFSLKGLGLFFNLVASILRNNSDIPIVGLICRVGSLFFRALAIVVSPGQTRSEKLYTTLSLFTLIGLTIAAFFVGSFLAATIGIAISAGLLLMEAVDLAIKRATQVQATKAYDRKKQFNEVIEKLERPKDNSFDEQFAIRAIELQHTIDTEYPNKMDKEKYKKQLAFIKEYLANTKPLDPTPDPLLQKDLASQLQALYKQRDQRLEQLKDQVTLAAQKIPNPEETALSETIWRIQDEIQIIDIQIDVITQPLKKLEIKKMMATEQVALSAYSIGLVLIGSAIAVVALLTVASVIMAPYLVIPILFGIGIAAAVFNLARLGAEKMVKIEDTQFQEWQESIHKESILDEALYQYDLSNDATKKYPVNRAADTSHVVYMEGLLAPQAPVPEPPNPQQSNTPPTKVPTVSDKEEPEDALNPAPTQSF